MISYQTLLQEIEQLAASTKDTKDDQKIREQLAAIRALCNVGLTTETKSQASRDSNSSWSAAAIRPSQKMQSNQNSQHAVQNASSLNGEKLKENDANGDSIFDF